MDRTVAHTLAIKMAQIQSAYLLRDTIQHTPELAVPHAVSLIHDWIHYLQQPALAIQFAVAFHPYIERWSAWPLWASVLDQVLDTCATIASASDIIRLLNYRSQAARQLGESDRALMFVSKALLLAEQVQDQSLIAVTLNKLGLIAFQRDELVLAQAHCARSYLIGQEHLSHLEMGNICMNRGLISTRQGHLADAEQYFAQALQHYQAEGDEVATAKVYCSLVDLQRRSGQLHAIPSILFAASDIFERRGARLEYGLVQNDIGYLYLTMGTYDSALQAFEIAVKTFEQIGATIARVRVLSNMIELYVTNGAWEIVVPIIQEARGLALLCQKPLLVAAIDVDQGRMLAAQGRVEDAMRMLQAALVVQQERQALQAAAYTRTLLDQIVAADRNSCESAPWQST